MVKPKNNSADFVSVSPGFFECQPSCPNYPEIFTIERSSHLQSANKNDFIQIHQHIFQASVLTAQYPVCSEVKFDYALCAYNHFFHNSGVEGTAGEILNRHLLSKVKSFFKKFANFSTNQQTYCEIENRKSDKFCKKGKCTNPV